MNPATFKHHTQILTRPQSMTDEECGPLPIFGDGQQCISLWKMSLRERFSALIFGKVWLWVWSGRTQPPVALEARREIFKEIDG
jgi:hypothetical protein